MNKRSFLIRFIDIGLILLFGFVIISDITVRSQIALPGTNSPDTHESLNVLLYVEMLEGYRFRVTEMESDLMYDEIHGLDDLENLLLQIHLEKRELNTEAIAVLHPEDEEVTMQQLVDVLDICDRIGMQRNINIPVIN